MTGGGEGEGTERPGFLLPCLGASSRVRLAAPRPKLPQLHSRMTMTPHDSPHTVRPAPAHGGEQGTVIEVEDLTKRYGSLTAVRRHILRRRRRRGIRHTRPQRRGQDYHAGVHRGPDRADFRPHDGAGHGDTPGLGAHPRAHRRSAPGLRLLRPPHAQGDTRTLRPVLPTKRTLRGIARHGGPG